MWKHVEVTREAKAGLAQEYWRFWYDERIHALVLDSYANRERPSLRHKFRTVGAYERLGRRQRLDGQYVSPPLPDDVAREAHQKFAEGLRVIRDKEDV